MSGVVEDVAEEEQVPEKATRGRTRQDIGEILNDEERRAKIRTLVDNVLELQGVEWGYCPKCKQKVQVQTADLKGRIDGLIKLLEQAEGKPQDGQSLGTTLVIERIWPPDSEPIAPRDAG